MPDNFLIRVRIPELNDDLFLPPLIRIPTPLPTDDNDEAAKIERTVMLLGGGGAKGCFQAGALGFLYATGQEEYRPNLVCGTSVGALNAILTTESAVNEDESRIKDLWQIWLNLKWKTDFFDNSPDVIRLDGDLPDFIEGLSGFKVTDLGDDYIDQGYSLHDDEVPRGGGGLSGGASGGAAVGGILAGFGAFGLFSSPAGAPILAGAAIAGYFIGKGIQDDIESAKNIRALYTLSPLRRLIRSNINEALLKKEPSSLQNHVKIGDVGLRMVSVDIESGNLCWIDNCGHFSSLQRRKQTQEVYQHLDEIRTFSRLYSRGVESSSGERFPLSFNDTITEGALGSAAIPLAFPPGFIATSREFDLDNSDAIALFDGGVKDVVPTQAAEDYLIECADQELPTLVITIANQPQYGDEFFGSWNKPLIEDSEHPNTYSEEKKYWAYAPKDIESFEWPNSSGTNIIELALRAVGLQSDEIARTDGLDITDLNIPLDKMLISPTFSVNGTGQIDVGLTRINLAYGWMRACDISFLRKRAQQFSQGLFLNESSAFYDFFLAKRTSDLITRLRMNCWRLEMRCSPSQYWADRDSNNDQIVFEDNVIELIRNTKNRLASQISERARILADFEYPAFPTEDFISDSSPDTWLEFEPHSANSLWYAESYQTRLDLLERLTDYSSLSLWGDQLTERSLNTLPSAARPRVTL